MKTNVLADWDSPLPPPKPLVGRSKPEHFDELFLMGPVPSSWIRRMGNTNSSQACKVGLALWMLKGMKKSNVVRLGSTVRASMGIERNAASRGLKKLEAAGLIEILEQKQGRHPKVKIVVGGGADNKKPGKHNQ